MRANKEKGDGDTTTKSVYISCLRARAHARFSSVVFISRCSYLRNNNNSTRCSWCNVSFLFSNMERRAVTIHMEGRKHLKWTESCNYGKVNAFFKPVLRPPSHTQLTSQLSRPTPEEPSGSQSVSQSVTRLTSDMRTFLLNDHVTEAEVL
ncbi:hypothetical protein PR048_006766 [Dryococelus australis]|uniref:U1-type domain-containing protein n=1 Tax=Dryococelus australis TaxID=614101 RepID=A0ABQ9ICV1_9NEOP|nr:hypothetical protein PR048_006766 [Dryococelus australis]